MYAIAIYLHDDEGRHTITRPTWDDIEKSIRQLDAHAASSLAIEGDEPTNMAIGGGDGRYVAQITLDGLSFHYLRNPTESGETESLVVGGQELQVPKRDICTLDQVLAAAKSFATEGKIDEGLSWEKG